MRYFREDEVAEKVFLTSEIGRRPQSFIQVAPAATWQGGVQWWQLATGLAMASEGQTETKKEDQRSSGPIIELEPDVETIQVWSKI